MVACSSALDKTAEFGIADENVFGFWDWVGGRVSVSCSVSAMIVAGLWAAFSGDPTVVILGAGGRAADGAALRLRRSGGLPHRLARDGRARGNLPPTTCQTLQTNFLATTVAGPRVHNDGARCVAAGCAAASKHPRAHGPARRVEYLLPRPQRPRGPALLTGEHGRSEERGFSRRWAACSERWLALCRRRWRGSRRISSSWTWNRTAKACRSKGSRCRMAPASSSLGSRGRMASTPSTSCCE